MGEEIRKYDSISTFLNDCKTLLMQEECENNVILGICNKFINISIDPEKFILIAAIEKGGAIISCAVTTANKTALAIFITQIDAAVKPLANYFNHHCKDLKGVSGKTAVVNSFMETYQKAVAQSITLLLNIMKNLQSIELVPNSELKLATMQDLPLLTTWFKNFQIDAGLLPLRPDDEIQAVTADKIEKQILYKLMVSGIEQCVSMVTVPRETENFAMISWVYTPAASRNKGFASTAVYKLTKLLLQTQQKQCALFTDKANFVSNKIYQNIGYQPVAEYLDIDFSTL